jgi:trimeric autotransporter adhesin
VSSLSLMFNFRQVVRLCVRTVIFGGLLAAWLVPAAYGQQNFILTPSTLIPAAVDPGGVASATIDLSAVGSFASPVALSCVVTPNTGVQPSCLISPDSATPHATLSLTVTALSTTTAGQYTITVSGTSGSETETATLFLNVVQAEQDYTLTISQTVSPSAVNPGGGATALITVTPTAGYSGTVTLSCLSVTPSVVASPYCSFASTADSSQPSVSVANGEAATATLTLSTYGPEQSIAEVSSPRILRGFWLAMPGLVLAGLGAGGKRRKKLLGFLLLLGIAAGFLMLPACGSGTQKQSNNNNGYVTPKNSYTFTLTGVDAAGIAPSNGGTTGITVSLTVN